MKDTETRTAKIEDGQIVIPFPKKQEGTKITVEIVHTAVPPEGSKESGEQASFSDLGLLDELVEAVSDLDYRTPTPIQAQSIPIILEGRDVLATAQTGSGKSAAFILPLLQQLSRRTPSGKRFPRALILTPTRELASQIAQSVKEYGTYLDLRQVVIYGGVSQRPQVKRLRKGKDIVIATPGRLLDLINQGVCHLDGVEHLVLDEADRMMDMGFMPDIKRVTKLIPDDRQILLFSATMPEGIQQLAGKLQHNPVKIAVDAPASTVDTVNSYVYHVEKEDKYDLLLHLLNSRNMPKTLIFMRTRRSATKLAKKLNKASFEAVAIHGDKSQHQREQALEDFRTGVVSILVGTDVASRGIDVEDISHVINYDISPEPEAYVHRIGRTARAGKSGAAFSFVSQSERRYLARIEQLTKDTLILADDNPFHSKKKGSKGGSRDRRGKRHSGKKGKKSKSSSKDKRSKHSKTKKNSKNSDSEKKPKGEKSSKKDTLTKSESPKHVKKWYERMQ